MEKTSGSRTSQIYDLICPITLDVYRDPVRAGDGYVYERSAIIRWIEEQGTSPLTREPLNVNDLRSEENIKRLCELYRCNAVEYSCRTNIVSFPPSPIIQSNEHTEQQISCKQYCNTKRALLISMAISFIISPFMVATSVILFLERSNSMAPSKI
jgi:hypothetical protein